MSSYEEAVRAGTWLNDNTEMLCGGNLYGHYFVESPEIEGQMIFSCASQLIAFAKSKGWDGGVANHLN